ncbi:MAG: hypothetical protein WKG01_00390 [Kofleriaceae bacterium]
MRSNNCLLVALLAPSVLACVTETDVSEEPRDESEPITEPAPPEAAALCPAPPTPPPWNRSWLLTASNPTDGGQFDPPNGQCDSWVINAHNVESLLVSVTSQTPDPDKCVGTSVTARRYVQGSSGWTYAGAATATGVWTIDGCRLPSLTWTTHTTSNARIHITTKRSYPSGGFTVTTYGLPFQARGWVYVQESPN